MVTFRRLFGNQAERVAEQYLKRKGFRILFRQYRSRFGEIDLIALDGDEVVFVEVKARTSNAFGYPEESVTPQKLDRIIRMAHVFMQERDESSFRVDVVAIEGRDFAKITHFEGVDLA